MTHCNLELKPNTYPNNTPFIEVHVDGQQIGSLTQNVEGFKIAAFNNQPTGALFPTLNTALLHMLGQKQAEHYDSARIFILAEAEVDQVVSKFEAE